MASVRVLLVDQERITRPELLDALENEPGIGVLAETSDVSAAMLLMQELKPDVIIIGLADPTCAEMIGHIRGSNRSTRVVMISSIAEPAYLLLALKAGAHGVLLRRMSNKTLVDAVRAVHAGGTFISAEASAALMSGYVKQPGGREIAGPLHLLSVRERQVLDLVVQGQSSNQIAEQLAISPKSVSTYRGRMMHKIGVSSLSSLLSYAQENGLMPEQA